MITEVEVEYEEIVVYKQTLNEGFGSYYHKEESEFVLKINPDHTINIKHKKEEWSREEVIVLLQKLADDIDNNYRSYTRDNSIGFDMLNNDGQWIEENL